jgi:hypothetical protein
VGGGVPWGTREPERLGTAGLLCVVVRWRIAPAGGSKNLPDASGQSVNFSTTDLDKTGHYLGALAVSNRWHTRPFCETVFLASGGLIGA